MEPQLRDVKLVTWDCTLELVASAACTLERGVFGPIAVRGGLDGGLVLGMCCVLGFGLGCAKRDSQAKQHTGLLLICFLLRLQFRDPFTLGVAYDTASEEWRCV